MGSNWLSQNYFIIGSGVFVKNPYNFSFRETIVFDTQISPPAAIVVDFLHGKNPVCARLI